MRVNNQFTCEKVYNDLWELSQGGFMPHFMVVNDNCTSIPEALLEQL
jgi:hypothetical protein